VAKDPMEKRFEKKAWNRELGELSKRTRSAEDIEAEEEMLKNTEKVEPIKADEKTRRNDPCPCGSGKKYKKCCGAK